MGKLNARFFVKLAATIAACAFLMHLGFWQLERLTWKRGLIAQIDAEKTVDAAQIDLAKLVFDPQNELRRGFLKGAWLETNYFTQPQALDGQWKPWVVTPLQLADGSTVLVNRGRAANSVAVPAKEAKVMGTLRLLKTSKLAEIKGLPEAAPLVLYMEASEPEDTTTPVPSVAPLRNEHLNYAIFWFAMAALSVIFFLISLRGRRSASSPDPSSL
jgi:surfeit locus 1 family protein